MTDYQEYDFTNMKQDLSKIPSQLNFTRILQNLNTGRRRTPSKLNAFTQADVEDWLSNISSTDNQKNLIELSEILFQTSRHYKLLIQHFSNMPKWAYEVVPVRPVQGLVDNATIIREYYDVAKMAKEMTMKQEFRKVLENALIRDTFYGYVHHTNNGYYIQKFDNSICHITSVEDGVYNFGIDVSTFERSEDILKEYPLEVQRAYEEWKKAGESGTKISPIVELYPKNTICIKINDGIIEEVPPFAGAFESVFEIRGFKESRKNQENLSNYMLISQKIPMRDSAIDENDFQLDEPAVKYFHNMLVNVLPDNVGAVTTPMNIEHVKFERDKVNIDNVQKAERDFWQNAGVSQSLFSSENNTSEGIRQSLRVDENSVFAIIQQFERWFNRFIKYKFGRDFIFRINILPITNFNEDTYYKKYLEVATYGLPVKTRIASAIGLEPLDMYNMLFIENDVFELHTRLVPLASSHTMATDRIVAGDGDNEVQIKQRTDLSNPQGGRPTNVETGEVDSESTDAKNNRVD